MAIVAQGPGWYEENGRLVTGYDQFGQALHEPHPPAPFLGPTGYRLGRQFLPLAGLERNRVSLHNAVRCRWNHTDTLPPLSQRNIRDAIAHCTRAFYRPPAKARTFMAQGEYATYALTGVDHDFTGWRGYVLPYRLPGEPRVPQHSIWTPLVSDRKVLVTFHLAYLFRDADAEPIAGADWAKLPLVMAGEWPERFPGYSTVPPSVWPSLCAFDTEFEEEHPERLVRWSLATPDRKIYVVEARDSSRITISPGSTIVVHNAPADIPHLGKIIDLKGITIDDTMYKHSVLWTGAAASQEGAKKGKRSPVLSHKLNFIGSLYARFNRWKHLAKVAPRQYAGADALGTMDCDRTGFHGGLQAELDRDPRTKRVYEELTRPLIPLIMDNKVRGIPVNQERAREVADEIKAEQTLAVLEAIAYTGIPTFKLSSPDQVRHWLYSIEGIKPRRRR